MRKEIISNRGPLLVASQETDNGYRRYGKIRSVRETGLVTFGRWQLEKRSREKDDVDKMDNKWAVKREVEEESGEKLLMLG